MNVRINLLPHREMRRERRKKEFTALLVATVLGAALAAFGIGMIIDSQISAQRARNDFIRAENARLDVQIREIATLRAEIDSLRARQQAVETLQSDRTVPVHLFDELVARLPDGAFLKSVRQDARKVSLVGLAQSNERISVLLRDLANASKWLERPELVEIRAVPLAAQQSGRTVRQADDDGRRIYEFSVNALIRNPQSESETRTPAAPHTAAPSPVARK
ncbi:MAG: PilN domain-containing protein [Burkholderiaceae bacterium]